MLLLITTPISPYIPTIWSNNKLIINICMSINYSFNISPPSCYLCTFTSRMKEEKRIFPQKKEEKIKKIIKGNFNLAYL